MVLVLPTLGLQPMDPNSEHQSTDSGYKCQNNAKKIRRNVPNNKYCNNPKKGDINQKIYLKTIKKYRRHLENSAAPILLHYNLKNGLNLSS